MDATHSPSRSTNTTPTIRARLTAAKARLVCLFLSTGPVFAPVSALTVPQLAFRVARRPSDETIDHVERALCTVEVAKRISQATTREALGEIAAAIYGDELTQMFVRQVGIVAVAVAEAQPPATPVTFGALRVGNVVRRSGGRIRITAIEPNDTTGINGQPVNNLGASLLFDGDCLDSGATTAFVGRERQVLGRDCQVVS